MSRLLLITFSCLILLDAAGIHLLRKHRVYTRYEAATATEFRQIGLDSPAVAAGDVQFFAAALPDDVRSVEAILRWTMEQVPAIGNPGSATTARQAYELAKAGDGLACGQMANLFEHALVARGHQARRVQLVRSLFANEDTHMTVEVLDGDRWVLYDPTFHVSFRHQGRLVGAADIHDALLKGQSRQIQPVFYGEVRYPARLGDYYVHWRPLFNNVFVASDGGTAFWHRLPPFRYWTGPQWHYYNALNERPLWHAEAISDFYFLFTVILPLMILITGLALLGALGRRLAKRSSLTTLRVLPTANEAAPARRRPEPVAGRR